MAAARGAGPKPRTILEELQRIHSTDIVLPTEDGRELRLRCIVRPDAAQALSSTGSGSTSPSDCASRHARPTVSV